MTIAGSDNTAGHKRQDLTARAFDVRVRSFGLRVARLSPRLALGFGLGTAALWAAMPEHFLFWLAELGLGLALSPFLIRFYKTGSELYPMLYGAILGGAGVPIALLTLGSFGPVSFAGIVPLMAGVSVPLAIMKNHLIAALDDS